MKVRNIGAALAMAVCSMPALADIVKYKFPTDAITYVDVLPSAVPGTFIIEQMTGAEQNQRQYTCYYLVQGPKPTTPDGVEQVLNTGKIVSFSCTTDK